MSRINVVARRLSADWNPRTMNVNTLSMRDPILEVFRHQQEQIARKRDLEALRNVSAFSNPFPVDDPETSMLQHLMKKQRVCPVEVATPASVSMSNTPQQVSGSSSSFNCSNTNNNREALNDASRFRPYQSSQWSDRFQELIDFSKSKGHCCVPHTYKENPALARWVKRQRYQYKLRQDGKQSTMTQERIVALEEIGFIWDSHGSAWMERWNELRDFKIEHKHCNVPSNYSGNPQRKLFLLVIVIPKCHVRLHCVSNNTWLRQLIQIVFFLSIYLSVFLHPFIHSFSCNLGKMPASSVQALQGRQNE